MKTDIPLKVLFRLRAADLLALTGDQQAELLSTDVVELQAVQRRVDFVYKLRLGSETYFRHLEFQAEADPEMPDRCFQYNPQMILQYKVPVVTTVIYLFPHLAVAEPVYRVMLAGREINRWQFESLRLWEIDAQAALRQGLPGMAALVPLMKGADLSAIEAAARQIEATPTAQQADLLAILHGFA
jgi:predicted transposase YdaD